MPCHFCGAENKICYWGPCPVKPWKRPVLLALSALFLIGGAAFAWTTFCQENAAGVILGAFPSALGALGIVISLFGCDECVARFSGRFDIVWP